MPCIVDQACNCSTWEVEAGGVKTSLVYISNSTARCTLEDLVSKNHHLPHHGPGIKSVVNGLTRMWVQSLVHTHSPIILEHQNTQRAFWNAEKKIKGGKSQTSWSRAALPVHDIQEVSKWQGSLYFRAQEKLALPVSRSHRKSETFRVLEIKKKKKTKTIFLRPSLADQDIWSQPKIQGDYDQTIARS